MAYGKVFFTMFFTLFLSIVGIAVYVVYFSLLLEYDYKSYGSQADHAPPLRQRHFYTESQLEQLEADFVVQQFPNQERRQYLAAKIGVTDRSILVFSVVAILYVDCYVQSSFCILVVVSKSTPTSPQSKQRQIC